MKRWLERILGSHAGKIRPAWLFAAAAALALIIFGLVNLIGYGGEYQASRETAEELRKVYNAAATETPDATPEPVAASCSLNPSCPRIPNPLDLADPTV